MRVVEGAGSGAAAVVLPGAVGAVCWAVVGRVRWGGAVAGSEAVGEQKGRAVAEEQAAPPCLPLQLLSPGRWGS